jgi:HlyD family secretion protein
MRSSKFPKKTLAVVVIVVLAIGLYLLFQGENGETQYKTTKVRRTDIMESVSATGRVNPVLSVSVGTQVSGTIKNIYVDYNDTVKKGQVVIELDREVYASRLAEAESDLVARRAQVAIAQAEFSRQDSESARIRELFDKGFISKNEYETADYGLKAAKASLDLAKADLKRAEATLAEAKENLSKTIIRSPVDGVVLTKDVEEGQTVSASLQAPTLLTVGDLTKMEIHASVDEADVGRVKVGQRTIFYVDSFPDREFSATVSKIHYSPTIDQSVVTYDVLMYYDNSDLLLRPGMTADIVIVIAEKKDALVVPNSALRVKLQGNDKAQSKTKGPSVWVLEGGRPVMRSVKLGMGDEDSTEVVDGLEEGETIIVEAPNATNNRRSGFRWMH